MSIDHVGSTSVLGLPAKPIIDILLQVADTADEPSYLPALERCGYAIRIRDLDWYQHRCCYSRVEEHGAPHDVNVHVFSPQYAAEEIERMLAFRNWLRTHPADRDQYATVKRELAARAWKYVQNYADAKTDVVQGILSKALTG